MLQLFFILFMFVFVSFVLVLIKLVSKAEKGKLEHRYFLFWNFVKLDQFFQTSNGTD